MPEFVWVYCDEDTRQLHLSSDTLAALRRAWQVTSDEWTAYVHARAAFQELDYRMRDTSGRTVAKDEWVPAWKKVRK